MKHYHTIQAMAEDTTQLKLSKLLSKRLYHIKDGHMDATVADEEFIKAVDACVEIIGGRKKPFIRTAILNGGATLSHYALGRFVYSSSGKGWSYCAGQSYDEELRDLRKYLLSL